MRGLGVCHFISRERGNASDDAQTLGLGLSDEYVFEQATMMRRQGTGTQPVLEGHR